MTDITRNLGDNRGIGGTQMRFHNAHDFARMSDEFISTIDAERMKKMCLQDEAFSNAMQAAIDNGKEHASVGVYKDDTSLIGTRFSPVMQSSGCSSSAASCADIGERGGAL